MRLPMGTLQIRPDIHQKYGSLFGHKTVNGRAVVVEELMARMAADAGSELPQLLAERHDFQRRGGEGGGGYVFLPADLEVSDADGRTAAVGAIRQGMLDR